MSDCWNGGNADRMIGEPREYRGVRCYEISLTVPLRVGDRDIQATLWEIDGLKPGDVRPYLHSFEDCKAYFDEMAGVYSEGVLDTVTSTGTVMASGRGLALSITKEARLMGLNRGDPVEFTLTRPKNKQ